MKQERASLEVIAPSVKEAIAKGLSELGLPEEAVEVEVLDSGSRGLLGLGTRQARVRLTIKVALSAEEEPTISQAEAVRASEAALEQEAPQRVEAALLPELEQPGREAPEGEIRVARRAEEEELALRVARETVTELLVKMGVRATVTTHYEPPDEEHSKPPLLVDVRGKDLSILIGPRAETLNALQFIASLIINKELGRSVPLIVDVEGYRARRSRQIRQLARRMADQAIKTGRRQVLEPMPANERRLVHIELRDNPSVTTESIGEEPHRKVTIIPKTQ